MDESEVYEDADSKIAEPSKNNAYSNYQDAQSKIRNSSKKKQRKENESSSIYQDAQSKITNNSGQNNAHINSFSPKNQRKNMINLKKENFKKNNDLNGEYEEEINIDSNKKQNEENENYFINNINNNNEDNENIDKVNKSEYSEPLAENIIKTQTLFEGESQRGGCCNLPKCIII